MQRRGVEARRLTSEWARSLSPLPITPDSRSQIHMMCGSRDADMALVAAWSVLRFAPGTTLVLHSDGSLQASQVADIERLVRRVVCWQKHDAHGLIREHLGPTYPRLAAWSQRHIFGPKFVAPHLVTEAERVVLMDSDVLCFQCPSELLASWNDPVPSLRWCRDVRTSYPADVMTIRTATGIDPVERLNAGLLLAKRWDDGDLAFFEDMLARLEHAGIDVYHHWAEQLMYGLSASRHRVSQALPEAYELTFGATSRDAVMRHYVGIAKVRPRFWLEGIPMLQASVGH